MTDWKPGDLALCVDAAWFDQFGEDANGPRLGSVHRVAATGIAPEGFTWIDLDGWGDLGMDARQFRRILPDKHEPAKRGEHCEMLEEVLKKVRANAAVPASPRWSAEPEPMFHSSPPYGDHRISREAGK